MMEQMMKTPELIMELLKMDNLELLNETDRIMEPYENHADITDGEMLRFMACQYILDWRAPLNFDYGQSLAGMAARLEKEGMAEAARELRQSDPPQPEDRSGLYAMFARCTALLQAEAGQPLI